MALPVVMKSGKNYMTLVLDDEMEFPELLQHIVTKFVESEKFFGTAPFAVMIEGRELTDKQKCQMLDAIAEYSSKHEENLYEAGIIFNVWDKALVDMANSKNINIIQGGSNE